MSKKISLQVGGTYKNRRGVVIVIGLSKGGVYEDTHPFEAVNESVDRGDSYRKDGSFSVRAGEESAWDIVEVVSEVVPKESFMDTHKKTVQWGEDRDMYTESDAQQQASKGLEEFAELVGNVSRIKLDDDSTQEEREAVKDDIGDIMVCLTHVAHFYGLTLKGCYQHSYNEIKDRKGRMVGGKFVKEDADV